MEPLMELLLRIAEIAREEARLSAERMARMEALAARLSGDRAGALGDLFAIEKTGREISEVRAGIATGLQETIERFRKVLPGDLSLEPSAVRRELSESLAAVGPTLIESRDDLTVAMGLIAQETPDLDAPMTPLAEAADIVSRAGVALLDVVTTLVDLADLLGVLVEPVTPPDTTVM